MKKVLPLAKKPLKLQLQPPNTLIKQSSLPRLNAIDRQKLQKYAKNKQKQQVKLTDIKNKLQVLTSRVNRYKSYHSKKSSTQSIDNYRNSQNGNVKNSSINNNNSNNNINKSIQTIKCKTNNQDKQYINKQNIHTDKQYINKYILKHNRNISNQVTKTKTNKTQILHRTNDKIYGNMKILFNHLQNKIKSQNTTNNTTNNNNTHSYSVDTIDTLYQQSKYSLLLSSSLILNTNNTITYTNIDNQSSKSYLTSPRDKIFDHKQQANKCINSMIATIGHQLNKLEQINEKNQNAMGRYMNGQLGLLELELYRNMIKNKTV